MGQSILGLLEHRNDLRFQPFSRLSADQLSLLKQCDVVIEFTTAEAAPEVIRTCISNDVPVVSGTTGWHEYHLESILSFCKQKHGKFLYASNFSIGMNIVFALNAKLANVLSDYPQFKPSLQEIHHIHKKDMPERNSIYFIGRHHEAATRLYRHQCESAGVFKFHSGGSFKGR
jgi:4-hydroxy-tetrahydrodipicolinate reductase